MPRIRRPVRRPVQQQLDLYNAGNYQNNLNHLELVRHLRAGNQFEYQAALMLETCLDQALDEQYEAHGEELEEAESSWTGRMGTIATGIEAALEDLAFERMSAEQFVEKMQLIAGAVQVMIDNECDLADAMPPDVPVAELPSKRAKRRL